MSAGYTCKDVILDGDQQAVAASATAQPVSAVFHIFEGDSLHFRADAVVSAVAGTVDFILQHSCDGQNWDNVKTFALTATGRIGCTLLVEVAADQTVLPLRPLGRFVATTGVGESLTLDAILLTRRI